MPTPTPVGAPPRLRWLLRFGIRFGVRVGVRVEVRVGVRPTLTLRLALIADRLPDRCDAGETLPASLALPEHQVSLLLASGRVLVGADEAARCAVSTRPCTRTCTAAWWLLTRGISGRACVMSGRGQRSAITTCLEVCHRLHYRPVLDSMLIVVRPRPGPASTLMTRPCRIGYDLPSTTMLTSICHHGTG